MPDSSSFIYGTHLESNLVELVKDDLVLLLLDLLVLAQDNIALALDSFRGNRAVLQDVREDVDGSRDVRLQGLRVVDGLLARSVGVQVSAQVLDLNLETSLRPGLGTLLSPTRPKCKPWSTGQFSPMCIRAGPTLKAMCSKKWAVPLFFEFSKREPASIHIPTVAVWKLGFDSVATVSPFDSLVICAVPDQHDA